MRIDRAVRTTYLKQVDSSKSPKHIDLGFSPPGFSGSTLRGIYRIDDDELVYCIGSINQPRPADFEIEEGCRETLVRLKRFSTGEAKIESKLREWGIDYETDREVGWIESVKLYSASQAKVFFPELAKLKRLKTLHAREVNDEVIGLLSEMNHLSWLKIQGDGITDEGLKVIGSLPQLASLEVDSRSVTDKAVEHFAKLKPEASLLLINTSVSVERLASLKSLDLRGLHLNNREISDDEFSMLLDSFSNLRFLELVDCTISNNAFSKIETLSELVQLKLNGSSIDDDSIREIAKLKKLTNLYIDDTKISDKGIQVLVNSKQPLEYLSFKRCEQLTESSLRAAISMPSLVYIWAAPDDFDDSVVEELQKSRDKPHLWIRK